ncbi:MAG TPA: phage portal protein [Archangium sp.]|uniref:phage portal protein n=1 Tax=Archangium sp. TaxID=1872627 RepID=UPI002E32FF31|nr:phage portal protein [Archangium sp.]HEX5750015.1 phage portal protein [Archangium sp.]
MASRYRPSLFERFKAAYTGLLLGPGAGRPAVHGIPMFPMSPRRGSRAVLASYRSNAWLQAVVDTVAEAVATPRWRVLVPVSQEGKALARACKGMPSSERDKLGGLERHKALARGLARGHLVELAEHELLNVLEAPHPMFTGRELRKVQQIHLDLAGESFLWLRRTLDGQRRVAGFEILPPQCVTHMPGAAGEPSRFLVTYNRLSSSVEESEILWLRHLDPEDLYGRGVGRGHALGNELDTAESIQEARQATFARGGLPAATVGIEGEESEDVAEDMEKKYTERSNKPSSAGWVWFVPGKVTLSQIQQDFRALQMDEAEKGLRDYIRQCFNIPPELLGDLTSSNRSTAEAAKYTLAEYAVLPRLEFLRTEYQLRLVPLIDADALLEYHDPRPHSWERTHQAMTASYGPHVLLNEARAHGGLPPLKRFEGVPFMPLPGAQPVQDDDKTPKNPPPPRGPEK